MCYAHLHQGDRRKAPEQSTLLHMVYSPDSLNSEPDTIFGAILHHLPGQRGMAKRHVQNDCTTSTKSAYTVCKEARASPPTLGSERFTLGAAGIQESE